MNQSYSIDASTRRHKDATTTPNLGPNSYLPPGLYPAILTLWFGPMATIMCGQWFTLDDPAINFCCLSTPKLGCDDGSCHLSTIASWGIPETDVDGVTEKELYSFSSIRVSSNSQNRFQACVPAKSPASVSSSFIPASVAIDL